MIMRKILIILALLITPYSYAAVSVYNAGISTNDLLWLNNATKTEGSFSALLNKPFNSTLTTSLGKSIPLPANWSASIPRASIASSAAKILKKAGPYGIAAYGLYSLLGPVIGLQSDGTFINGVTNGAYATGAAASAACIAAADSACKAYYNSAWSSNGGAGSCDAENSSDGTHGNYLPSCYSWGAWKSVPSPSAYANYTWGQTGTATPVTPTETELAQKIEQSSPTSAEIFDRNLADLIRENQKAESVDLLPKSAPASVTASPVVGPEETVSVQQVQNADGTQSTVTTKQQTTATPQLKGSTVVDAGVDWETSTKTTQTTVNNTTNETNTTVTTVNDGTTTTKAPDNGTFTGELPGDGYTAGHALISGHLCAGSDCATMPTCATGHCSFTERVNTMKAAYIVNPSASGECPANTADLSAYGYGNHSTMVHCTLMETVRGSVQTIMGIMIALGVIIIVLGA